VELVNRAYRLNPHYPPFYDIYVNAFYAIGQYDEVIARIRRLAEVPPHLQMLLAMSYAQLGRQADAATAKAELLRRDPDFSLERTVSDVYGVIPHQPTLALFIDGARKAGLNDCATEAELKKYPKMKHLAQCDARRATH
jgi:hypothetical protein